MGRSILGQWDHRVNTGHPGLSFLFFSFFFCLLGGGEGVSANNRSGKQWGQRRIWDTSLRNIVETIFCYYYCNCGCFRITLSGPLLCLSFLCKAIAVMLLFTRDSRLAEGEYRYRHRYVHGR